MTSIVGVESRVQEKTSVRAKAIAIVIAISKAKAKAKTKTKGDQARRWGFVAGGQSATATALPVNGAARSAVNGDRLQSDGKGRKQLGGMRSRGLATLHGALGKLATSFLTFILFTPLQQLHLLFRLYLTDFLTLIITC